MERSKLGVVTRTGRVPARGSLVTDDLVQAAATLEQQRKLLEPLPEDKRSERERAADTLGQHIKEAATGFVSAVAVMSGADPEAAAATAARVIHTTDGHGRKKLAAGAAE